MASRDQRKAKLAARLFAQLRSSVELGLVVAMQDLTPRSFLCDEVSCDSDESAFGGHRNMRSNARAQGRVAKRSVPWSPLLGHASLF